MNSNKYILIYIYNSSNNDELYFWEQLNNKLKAEKITLFLLLQIKPQKEVSFLYGLFTEKLDNVIFPKRFPNNDSNKIYTNYLKREEVWYGSSNKDRLQAAKYQKYKYETLINELNPNLLVLGNANHAGELILKDVAKAKNIPIVYLERGPLPKSWHIDYQGITAGSSIAKKSISDLNLNDNKSFKNYKPYYLNSKYTWWNQPEYECEIDIRNQFNIDQEQKLILFANQLNNDTSNFLYNSLFDSNIDAFEWFCNELSKEKLNAFVLAKKHPHYKGKESSFNEVIKKTGIKGVWVDNINLFDCLHQCDLVCSVNSTLNYEALLYENPVLQLGKSILNNKEVLYEIKNNTDTNTLLDWFHEKNIDVRLKNYELFMTYLIDNELSFFFKDAKKLNLNSADFFIKSIIPYVDNTKSGKFPKRFNAINNYKPKRSYLSRGVKKIKSKLIRIYNYNK